MTTMMTSKANSCGRLTMKLNKKGTIRLSQLPFATHSKTFGVFLRHNLHCTSFLMSPQD